MAYILVLVERQELLLCLHHLYLTMVNYGTEIVFPFIYHPSILHDVLGGLYDLVAPTNAPSIGCCFTLAQLWLMYEKQKRRKLSYHGNNYNCWVLLTMDSSKPLWAVSSYVNWLTKVTQSSRTNFQLENLVPVLKL
jgi:hypothetical protein